MMMKLNALEKYKFLSFVLESNIKIIGMQAEKNNGLKV